SPSSTLANSPRLLVIYPLSLHDALPIYVFPVIDVAGADTAFYRLIRAAAEQGNRSRSLQREHSLVFKEYDSFCRRSSRQSSVFFFACGRLLLQAAAVCPFFHHSYLFICHHFFSHGIKKPP